MKSLKRIALGAAILAAILASGCKSNNAQQNNQSGNQRGPNGQMPEVMSGTQGIITAVSADSISISVMPADSMPQGGMGRNPGRGNPDASGRPAGTPPANDSSMQPNDDGAQPPLATMDTSGWAKKTYAIGSSTKIEQMQLGNPGTQSTALQVSDLKVGDTVNIQESSDNAGRAGTITVIHGMGDGPVPNATSKP